MLAIATLAGVFACHTRPQISEADAREQLRRGALVVDVRTTGEYRSRHLANTINIPLSELKDRVPAVVTNKGQILLLHCLSGHRSAIAESELRSWGYTNAFSIGSFGRAEKILGPP